MSEERMLAHAKPEYALASDDLKKLGTRVAVVNFYARHDAKLHQVGQTLAQPLACEAGCSFCCRQFDVVAQPAEVLEIQAHVSRHFKPEQLRGVIQRASQNVADRKAATEKERLTLRPVCPFLVDHACSIYAVRPSVCRNFHATDKNNCQKSFDEPFSTWPTSYADEVFTVAMGSSAGFKNAVTDFGLDTQDYFLSSAFLEAMRDPACAKRFKSGKRAFLKADTSSFNG